MFYSYPDHHALVVDLHGLYKRSIAVSINYFNLHIVHIMFLVRDCGELESIPAYFERKPGTRTLTLVLNMTITEMRLLTMHICRGIPGLRVAQPSCFLRQ